MITIPADAGVLLFTYSGMEAKEGSIGKKQYTQVVMENKVLNEVVVTGYQTLKTGERRYRCIRHRKKPLTWRNASFTSLLCRYQARYTSRQSESAAKAMSM